MTLTCELLTWFKSTALHHGGVHLYQIILKYLHAEDMLRPKLNAASMKLKDPVTQFFYGFIS
jgi:hypothetical protein